MDAKVVARLAQVRAAIKTLADEEKQLVAKIQEQFAAENLTLGHYDAGAFRIDFSRNARFDDTLAQQVLTPAQRKKVTVPKIDGTKIKEELGLKIYAQCQKESAPRITIKVIED